MKVVIVATMGMLMTVRIMMIRQVPCLTWKVSIASGSGKLTKWWWCPHMRVWSQGWWGINIPHVKRHHLQETRDAAKKNRRRQQTTKEQNWDDSYSASFSYTPKHTMIVNGWKCSALGMVKPTKSGTSRQYWFSEDFWWGWKKNGQRRRSYHLWINPFPLQVATMTQGTRRTSGIAKYVASAFSRT